MSKTFAQSLDTLKERYLELMDFIEEQGLQEEFIEFIEKRRGKGKQT